MELPVELFLALRYLRPRRSFVSIITLLSWGGVTIGVAVLIVVLSVMAGFQQDLSKRIIGFNSHITVAMTDGAVLYDADKAIALIKKAPGVVDASAFVRGPVEVECNGKMSPAFIKSVPEEGEDPVLPLKQFVKLGDYELRGDSAIVGVEWAKRMGVFPGDKMTIYGVNILRAIKQLKDNKDANVHDIPLPETPIIRGIFQTGQFDYDLNFILVSTEMAQRLYGLDDGGVHGIAVRVEDADRADVVKDELNAMLPATLHARTWMDDNQDLFTAIATERVVMALILYLVMIVAAFGLCSTLITITVQKSREIGLMKALGATDLQVCGVFLFHGVVVGLIGAISGTIGGLAILHYLNFIRDLLLKQFHIQVFASSIYGAPAIPSVINPWIVTTIAVSAVIVCILAALVPALGAAKLAPARALRYE